jgi:hypothetical protein
LIKRYPQPRSGALNERKYDCIAAREPEGSNAVSRLWSSFRSFVRACARRFFAKETLLCALGLLPGSIFVMAKLPPLWRDYDGLFQITSPPGHNLLASPHLYPFLSRLPVLLVSGLCNIGHLSSLQLAINRSVALNDAGLFLLIAIQQLLLVFALALLTVTCARRPIIRCVIVVLLLCQPVLFVGAQFVSSEALGSTLLIFLIAVAVELSRRECLNRNCLLALGLCLYAAIMTRHVAMIYTALMPVTYLLATIVRVRNPDDRRIHFRKFVVTCGIGFIAIVATNLTTRALCLILREPYRSVTARTAISRLDLIDQMPASDRARYLQSLQDKATDPITKEAIPAVLAEKEYWGGSMRVIEKLIERDEGKSKSAELNARADHYLSEICRLYYRSLPPVALMDIRDAIVRSLVQTTPTEVLSYLYHNAEESPDIYRSNPDLRKKTAQLKSCSPEAQAAIRQAGNIWWLRGMGNNIPCGIALGIIVLIAVVLRYCGAFKAESLYLLFALVITNALTMIGTFGLITYLPRYVLPTCVMIAAALAIFIGGINHRSLSLPSHIRPT